MGVWPQTNLGGHQIFARKICHCNNISKKKKGHHLFRCTFSIIFGLNMSRNVGPNRWWPFFFLEMLLQWQIFQAKIWCPPNTCTWLKADGVDNINTLTQIARKIKNCPKFCREINAFLQAGGPVPPGPPTSYAYACDRFNKLRFVIITCKSDDEKKGESFETLTKCFCGSFCGKLQGGLKQLLQSSLV